VGGGLAGLAGALTLVRARRSVLVVDAAQPRNAPAAHAHGCLTRDGTSPLELLAALLFATRGRGHAGDRGLSDSLGGLVGEGPDGADVDLAQNVGVVAVCCLRPVEEVGVPDGGQGEGVDSEELFQLRDPLLFQRPLERAVGRSVGSFGGGGRRDWPGGGGGSSSPVGH